MSGALRILREYGTGAGALILVLAFIINTLQPPGRAYVVTMALFGLLLLAGGLAADRERVLGFVKGRRGRAAGASVGYSLTVFAVVVLVNFLAGRHHARFDLTENRTFSLSEQTVKVLEGLPRDVSITAFFQDSEPTRQKLKDLLDEYRYRTNRLSVKFIDPDKNPAEVRRYEVTEYGTIVVESGEQDTRVSTADEESITNALIEVTSDRERVVYFTSGHGERNIEDVERGGVSILKEALGRQHYTVRALNLAEGVPADASLVVIAGPEKRFLESEAQMIGAYLERGGRLFLLQDPNTDAGLGEVLHRYGAAFRKDVVIDKVSQIFGGDARIPMVAADGYDEFHAVTKNFDYQTFYPMASSIAIDDDLPEQVTATRLAKTSEYSWGESSEEEVRSGRIKMDEGVDVTGPMTLGAALVRRQHPAEAAEPSPADDTELSGDEQPGQPDDETAVDEAPAGQEADEAAGAGEDAGEPPEPESRLLLFGDSDFITNAYVNSAGNADLALNGIAWLAEQGELVSIRPKSSTPRVVFLTAQQVFFYFWTIVGLAPIGIAVIGVGIWVRRRKL